MFWKGNHLFLNTLQALALKIVGPFSSIQLSNQSVDPTNATASTQRLFVDATGNIRTKGSAGSSQSVSSQLYSSTWSKIIPRNVVGIASTNESNNWESVCWAPSIQLFVAVAGSGSTNHRVMTSPDGITWTGIAPGGTSGSGLDAIGWASVCWSPQLSIFCAVGNIGTGNRVMTSPDGVNWTAQSSSNDTNGWASVIWSPDKSLFVAVASSGTNRTMTSPDGVTWTGHSSSNESNSWQSVCWSPALSLFVAVGQGGNHLVMTSPDGSTWTGVIPGGASGSGLDGSLWDSVCWSPQLNLFCAVSRSYANSAMTSSDGSTWTGHTISSGNSWTFICWAPELSVFIAVASAYLGASQFLATSPDGTSWTQYSTSNEANWWDSIVWSPELSMFVAVAQGGSTKRIMRSF